MTQWYSKFLARFYWLVVIIVLVCVAVCASVVIYLHGLPSFDDPTKGFEVRGTTLSKRLHAMTEFQGQQRNGTYTTQPNITALGGISRRKKRDVQKLHYSCYRPGEGEPVLCPTVISMGAANGGDMFTKQRLQSICKIHQALAKDPAYNAESRHSVPHYMEQIFNTTCDDLTDSMVEQMTTRLETCFPFYKGKQLDANCENNGQCVAPDECNTNDAVYQIFHYLVDKNFVSENGKTSLKYTNLVTHTFYGRNLDFYKTNFDGQDIEINGVKVMGLSLYGVKNDLFSEYLVSDIILFGVALALIFIVMFLYLRSILIMLATLLNVLFSFIMAYFLYYVVFRFTFFPFLNIFAGLILIAVGADDVFVYFDVWHEMKKKMEKENKMESETKMENEKNMKGDEESEPLHAQNTSTTATSNEVKGQPNSRIKFIGCHLRLLIHNTLKHATLSIFVTSFTTAAAFFANFSSNIVATRCFGIFAGTCILVNFIFMITWMPAVFIIVEKIDQNLLSGVKCCKCWETFLNALQRISSAVFTKIIPMLVIKGWFIWCVLLTGIGIAGIVLVFVTPKLTLPTSQEFQILPSLNPLEKYAQELKIQFNFENTEQGVGGQYVSIYWGILAADNGNWLNPDDKGTLELDSTFNFYSPESREWLVKFCEKLLQQDFIDESFANNTKCSLSVIEDLMSMNCSTPGAVPNCCGNSNAFEYCYPRLTSFYYQYVGYGFYDSANNVPVYYMSVQTNQPFVNSFDEMNNLYTKVNGFVEKEVENAPKGLNSGWFGGYFHFYNLQRSIAYGTYTTMGISIGVAFIVMLLTSLNVFITLYAIIAITFGIAATVGVLVLLGWELNVLESTIISLAVGFSIDFTIHYGVAYRLSHGTRRISRVTDSFHMIGSAVAMAAFTTFIAGAAIMPARILGYQRLGVFLMLVMFFSWIYATFFFQSLCRIIGPLGNFGSLIACCVKKQNRDDVVPIKPSQPSMAMHEAKYDNKENVPTQHTVDKALLSGNTSNIDGSDGSLPNSPIVIRGTQKESSEDTHMAPQGPPQNRGELHINDEKQHQVESTVDHVSVIPVDLPPEEALPVKSNTRQEHGITNMENEDREKHDTNDGKSKNDDTSLIPVEKDNVRGDTGNSTSSHHEANNERISNKQQEQGSSSDKYSNTNDNESTKTETERNDNVTVIPVHGDNEKEETDVSEANKSGHNVTSNENNVTVIAINS